MYRCTREVLVERLVSHAAIDKTLRGRQAVVVLAEPGVDGSRCSGVGQKSSLHVCLHREERRQRGCPDRR